MDTTIQQPVNPSDVLIQQALAKSIAGEVVIRNAIAKTIKCQCRDALLMMKTRSTVAPKTYRFKAYKPL